MGVTCSIKESSEPQNQWLHIVQKASKSAAAKGDVPKICGFVHPAEPALTHSLQYITENQKFQWFWRKKCFEITDICFLFTSKLLHPRSLIFKIILVQTTSDWSMSTIRLSDLCVHIKYFFEPLIELELNLSLNSISEFYIPLGSFYLESPSTFRTSLLSQVHSATD